MKNVGTNKQVWKWHNGSENYSANDQSICGGKKKLNLFQQNIKYPNIYTYTNTFTYICVYIYMYMNV